MVDETQEFQKAKGFLSSPGGVIQEPFLILKH